MDDFSIETGVSPLSGRELLEQFSKTGKFVFHGSSQELERLEPRQQTHFNSKTREAEPDGEPAVCAANNYEIAIFRALTNGQLAKKYGVRNYVTSFGIANGEPYFKGNTQSIALARRTDKVGYVYVCRRKDFQPHDNLESRAYHKIKPVTTVIVKSSDLPSNIEITEGPFL